MAGVKVLVHAWKEWGIRGMVLLSFALQVTLLITAEIRRRKSSGVLRAVVWSAYVLADSTAIYVIGHLSVTSGSSEQQLMAFWAPFLLLHLGGQDNITAYALEDNRLWLRHLQALAVQVSAAAYVLYESWVVGTQDTIRYAAILIFAVGVVKYGERVWALRRASSSKASRKNYQPLKKNNTGTIAGPRTAERDTEGLLLIAHLLLDVAKDLFQGPLEKIMIYINPDWDEITSWDLYKVVEMQLSLMHDVLYSKAEVILTWYGLCIRIISTLSTSVAFVLFNRTSGLSDDHSRGDVAITYILLAGAVGLETMSVLRAMFSRWPSALLIKRGYQGSNGGKRCVWDFLGRAVAFVRRLVLGKRQGSRWWSSSSMGQHNLIDMCVRSRASRSSSIAERMGVLDWWNTMVYSGSAPVTTAVKDLVLKKFPDGDMVKESDTFWPVLESLINGWGLNGQLGFMYKMGLEDTIVLWHIATDLYLRQRKYDPQQAALADATGALSNYMMFLLAARPYMLPPSVTRTTYVATCYYLTALKYSSAQEFENMLLHLDDDNAPEREEDNVPDPEEYYVPEREGIYPAGFGFRKLVKVTDVARLLIAHDNCLEMIAELWVAVLCYAGYKCSRYSHAKQLSNGGELITVAALMVKYDMLG